jgi:hypothetical protein
MFYPRSQAVFALEASLTWEIPYRSTIPQSGQADLILEVRIANRGTATAHDVLLRVESDVFRQGKMHFHEVPDWRHELDCFRKLTAMHPGVRPSKAVTFRWGVLAVEASRLRGTELVPHCPDPEFRFSIYAENQQPQYFTAKFGMDEVIWKRPATLVASPRDEP